MGNIMDLDSLYSYSLKHIMQCVGSFPQKGSHCEDPERDPHVFGNSHLPQNVTGSCFDVQ